MKAFNKREHDAGLSVATKVAGIIFAISVFATTLAFALGATVLILALNAVAAAAVYALLRRDIRRGHRPEVPDSLSRRLPGREYWFGAVLGLLLAVLYIVAHER